jgi:hypothetical protein
MIVQTLNGKSLPYNMASNGYSTEYGSIIYSTKTTGTAAITDGGAGGGQRLLAMPFALRPSAAGITKDYYHFCKLPLKDNSELPANSRECLYALT